MPQPIDEQAIDDQRISRQLNEVFQKASLSFARKTLTLIDDLERLSEINQNALDRRDDLLQRYRDEYDTRVDAERQRLHREAVQITFDHPAPYGAAVTDSDTIISQAHRHVRLAHDADLQRVDGEMQREIERLLEYAQRRN